MRLALLCCEAMQAIEAAGPSVRRDAAEAWLADAHRSGTPPEEWETELARLLREDNRAGLREHRAVLRRVVAEKGDGWCPLRVAALTCALHRETFLFGP